MGENEQAGYSALASLLFFTCAVDGNFNALPELRRSLPVVESYLKPGATLKYLDAMADECSENEAARRLNKARAKLFQLINKTNNAPPGLIAYNPSSRLMSELEKPPKYPSGYGTPLNPTPAILTTCPFVQ